MPEVLYKLRNKLTVKGIRNGRNMFVIVTKNKEIARLNLPRTGFSCGSVLHLVSDPDARTRLACRGGAYGREFDVVGYKRRPNINF